MTKINKNNCCACEACGKACEVPESINEIKKTLFDRNKKAQIKNDFLSDTADLIATVDRIVNQHKIYAHEVRGLEALNSMLSNVGELLSLVCRDTCLPIDDQNGINNLLEDMAGHMSTCFVGLRPIDNVTKDTYDALEGGLLSLLALANARCPEVGN